MKRWSLNARLAAAALGLGVVALAGSPQRGETVTIHPRELAALVEGELDHVTVDKLADWIVQGRADYRLLDVRDPEAYAAYHIPTAESVPLTGLAGYPLFRNEKIVVYSDGGMHSAQAWFLLRATGYPGSYILLRGLEEWKDRILFPAPPAGDDPAALADFERRASASVFFGGSPRTGAAAAAVAEVEMPEAPAAAPAPVARQRKRKEGC